MKVKAKLDEESLQANIALLRKLSREFSLFTANGDVYKSMSSFMHKTCDEAFLLKLKEGSQDWDGVQKKLGAAGILATLPQSIELKVVMDIASALSIDDWFLYVLSAYFGHLHVMQHLEAKAPNCVLEMIQANDYYAYQLAAQNGHLHVMQHLEAKAPDYVLAMIQADNYYAYRLAAQNGHLEVMQHLEAKAPANVLAMIKADNYGAYLLAAKNGHLHVMQHLEAKAPDKVLNMIQAEGYWAYQLAAKKGHLEVMKHLEAKAPNYVLAMIQAQNYYAYRLAAENGHLHVMQHIEAKAPNHVLAMIQANNYHAYREATKNHHPVVCHHLLSRSSACFAYAESHEREYGETVRSFIANTLENLRRESAVTAPNAVFNLNNDEQAKLCFYILRNLIRQNNPGWNDDIQFLLTIPAVRELAHQSVNGGMDNELLRLAQSLGNRDAAAMLLNIEAVRSLAEQNHFYRQEANRGIDLSALACDRESSMTALSVGEQKRLESAIKRYQPMIAQAGITSLMMELREVLKSRYQANPATIESNGKTLVLPMDFEAFERLNLTNKQQSEALKAYYQHKDHTAYRYLSKPNRWMHPDAAYVCVDKNNYLYANFEEYQSLITMLWLAAVDETSPPLDGFTIETRLEHFISELALIGRAHNWDKTRLRADGKGYEEYDDLEGDRPSCYSGVKRRLFLSVMGHPLLTILTENGILQEIRAFVRAYFKARITTDDNRKALLQAYQDYCIELSDESAQPLSVLNLTAEAITEFKALMSKKYGESYTNEPQFIRLTDETITVKPDSKVVSDHFSALSLDGLTGFGKMLCEPNSMSQQGMFSTSRDRADSQGSPPSPGLQ